MDVEAIANERGLVPGTIEGHLAKAVATGRVGIHQFMSQQAVDEVSHAITELADGFSSKDLFIQLEGKYTYGQLRAVMNHLLFMQAEGKKE